MDVFSMTGQLEDAILGEMVERLETRGAHPRFVAMMDDYLDAMAIAEAREVLDLGCGTGIVARAITMATLSAGRESAARLRGLCWRFLGP